MAFEIKIYGDIVPFQDSWIVESGMCNLTHVQNQLKEANGDDVRVRINSWGGDVDEGFAIYSELRRYAKENEAQIEVFAEGRCASIATVIFLAGDKRILNEYVEPFVHNAWAYVVGDSRTVQRVATDLESCNEKIANHYALHTDLTYDEARLLMDNESSISPTEALNIRFATEIEEILRPVALQRFSNKPKNKNMSETKDRGVLAKIREILNMSEKPTIQNKILFTAEQKEVDFYELNEDDIVEVGAKANIDGSPADGEVVMADGMTYKFDAGTLTEIEEAEEMVDDKDAKIVELEAQIESLKASSEEKETKINSLNATIDIQNKQIEKIKALESEFEVEKKEPAKKEIVKNSVSAQIQEFKKNKFKQK